VKLVAIPGNTQKLDGGAMYGNAPRAVWQGWSPPDERNRITLACRALLVETDTGERWLFEAGIGAFFDPKMKDRFGVVEDNHVLLDNLSSLGIKAESIDRVILSHLHFDHAGGLLSRFGDGPMRLVFPNAQFYVGRQHWDRANAPHSRDKASFIPELQKLLTDTGRLTLVEEGQETDLSPTVRFHFSHGHTPGLMLAEIATPKGPVVFAADLVPGMPWVHIPITMGYDRYPELLIEEKSSLYERLLPKHGMLFFTHDPNVACAALMRDEKGRYRAEPVDLATFTEGSQS
jgi:glyoxylase-like metal-dependent hydrolase (beta-lactamase superfamily II)